MLLLILGVKDRLKFHTLVEYTVVILKEVINNHPYFMSVILKVSYTGKSRTSGPNFPK